jgi:hypothetical protein
MMVGDNLHNIHVATYMKYGDDFESIDDLLKPPVIEDEAYIEGALELVIDGIVISDLSFWDYIDQLWDYIIQGIELIREGKPWDATFPDMPVRLAMTPLPGNRILLERGETRTQPSPAVKIAVDQGELVDALLAGAEAFSDYIANYDPIWTQNEVPKRIQLLKDWRLAVKK